MKNSTKLRLVGGLILLFNLWLVGEYKIEGILALLLTFGFALGFEVFIVSESETTGNPKPISLEKIVKENWHWAVVFILAFVGVLIFLLVTAKNSTSSSADQTLKNCPPGQVRLIGESECIPVSPLVPDISEQLPVQDEPPVIPTVEFQVESSQSAPEERCEIKAVMTDAEIAICKSR